MFAIQLWHYPPYKKFKFFFHLMRRIPYSYRGVLDYVPLFSDTMPFIEHRTSLKSSTKCYTMSCVSVSCTINSWSELDKHSFSLSPGHYGPSFSNHNILRSEHTNELFFSKMWWHFWFFFVLDISERTMSILFGVFFLI